MADGKDLGALLGAAVAEEIVECRVDVSQWLGTDPETDTPVEFVYREPDLAALFIAHEDAAKIRMKASDWSERMCQSVAYMIHAHQAPAVKIGDSKGLIYIAMAQQRPHLFRRLWERVMETFASAGNIEEAAQAREGECEAQPEV